MWEVTALSTLGLLHFVHGDHKLALALHTQALESVRGYGNKRQEARVLTRMGHTLLALGQNAEAAISYQSALALQQMMEQTNRSMESIAGLAGVAQKRGQLEQARHHVETILAHLKSHTLERTEDVLLVYLTCYYILQACQDARAGDVLAMAHAQLQARAATIESEVRRKQFWSAPTHQAVLTATQGYPISRGGDY
jgi:tetratricopeptide (TPR) repeat protein